MADRLAAENPLLDAVLEDVEVCRGEILDDRALLVADDHVHLDRSGQGAEVRLIVLRLTGDAGAEHEEGDKRQEEQPAHHTSVALIVGDGLRTTGVGL